MVRRPCRPLWLFVVSMVMLLPGSPPSSAAATGFSVRINAGGGSYTDPAGRVWSADSGFLGGHASVPVARPVAGTDADPLYQKHRWSMSGYTVAVPCPATYRVDLHLAEVYFNAAGQRVFSVSAEGVERISALDVFAVAGRDTALLRSFEIAVGDGVLDLAFTRVVENPMVSAIEVTQVTECAGMISVPTPTTRLSAGGGAYTDPGGRLWAADSGFVGGAAAVPTPSAIAGTDADPLYQKHRWAMSSYDVAVPCPATYRVDLHFAEVYFYASGQRVFSVSAEGTEKISRLDVFAAAGKDTALVRSFDVVVGDGSLSLGFTKVVDNPMVSAIAMTRTSACSTTVAPPPAPVSYPVPPTIAADCSKPVDAEINAFLAKVPDNAVAVFAANGCYGQSGTITLADRTGLTVDGNGATFKALTAGDNVRKNWRLQGGSKMTLKNMTVRGANPKAGIFEGAYLPSMEFQHGYSIEGTQGATLANVQAYDVYGDFVAVHHDERFNPYTTAPARNVTITGARFERSGRQGVSPTNVEGFVLEKSYLGAVNMNAVDIELDFNEARVTDVKMQGNTFGSVRFSLLANVGAGSEPNVGRITVDDNTMVGPVLNCRPPVFVETPDGLLRSGYTITNNRLLAFGDAFIFSGAKNITVSGNTVGFTFAGCGTQAGVRLANSHTVSVTGNTFTGGTAVTVKDAVSTGVTEASNKL